MHVFQEARREGSIGVGGGTGNFGRFSPIVAQDIMPVVATPTRNEEDRVEVLVMAIEHRAGQLVRSGGKSGEATWWVTAKVTGVIHISVAPRLTTHPSGPACKISFLVHGLHRLNGASP
jgi:hypothetical protein